MALLRNILSLPLLLCITASTLLAMALVPGKTRRRRIARAMSRLALRVAGLRLTVRNLSALPEHACVIVANHTSYLDGMILTAALPARFAFVIKREMERVPLAGFLLRRIGSEFVERFNRHRGAMDTRRLLRRASEGQALVFFPEGTFSKQRGLLKFHTGAFATAMRAGCPVAPVLIRGARHALPPDGWLLNPGTIDVEILDAVPLPAVEKDGATRLKDAVRREMLERLGEPDLNAAA